MRSFLIFLAAPLFLGCGANVTQQNTNTPPPQRTEKLQTVAAHTTENQPPSAVSTPPAAGAQKGKWSQSGDPIDTAQFDAAIASAEKTSKAKPGDDSAKKSLADAYYRRAVALTDARQYASALGDYRRAAKLDPEHEDSRKWIEQIVMIYGSIGKEAPPEGQEPPPLPFKKKA